MPQKKLAKLVGKAIAERRRQLGMTQAQLAEKLDIGQDSLSRMEKGLISPKMNHLADFAQALQCSVADLFRDVSEDAAARGRAMAEMIAPLAADTQEAIVNMVATAVKIFHNPK